MSLARAVSCWLAVHGSATVRQDDARLIVTHSACTVHWIPRISALYCFPISNLFTGTGANCSQRKVTLLIVLRCSVCDGQRAPMLWSFSLLPLYSTAAHSLSLNVSESCAPIARCLMRCRLSQSKLPRCSLPCFLDVLPMLSQLDRSGGRIFAAP